MTAGELDGYRAVYEEEVAQISVLTLMVQEAASPESVSTPTS